jgi:hypothetical protein
MVTEIDPCVKDGVSFTGSSIVTEAGFEGPVYEPDPEPIQPAKLKPVFGVAEICTTAAESCQLLAGDPLPPVAVFMVK